MRDADIVTRAVADVKRVLADFSQSEPGVRDSNATLRRMLDILDEEKVVTAQKRLAAGFGVMRIVK